MRMVAEMLRRFAFLMQAVRSRNTPAHLEWQRNEQQEQNSFHDGLHGNRYGASRAILSRYFERAVFALSNVSS